MGDSATKAVWWAIWTMVRDIGIGALSAAGGRRRDHGVDPTPPDPPTPPPPVPAPAPEPPPPSPPSPEPTP